MKKIKIILIKIPKKNNFSNLNPILKKLFNIKPVPHTEIEIIKIETIFNKK